MGRSVAEILKNLQAIAAIKSPQLDTKKDIVYLFFSILSEFYSDFENNTLDPIARAFNLDFSDIFSEDVIDEVATRLGTQRQEGTAAKGYVTLVSNDGFAQISEIEEGNSFSTSDGSLSYSNPVTTTIDKSHISYYFNNTTGQYEITIAVECTTTGLTEALPYTVKVVSTNIPSIASVENRSRISGGTPREDNATLIARLQSIYSSANFDSYGKIVNVVKTQFPDYVLDIKEIDVFNQDFLRPVGRAAMDLVVIPPDTAESLQIEQLAPSMTAATNELILENQPIKEIIGVIDSTGTAYNWLLIKDTGTERDSYAAKDRLRVLGLSAALTDITITYTYYTFLTEMQNYIANYFPNFDVLIRMAHNKTIKTTIKVAVYPGFDKTTVETNVLTSTMTYLNPETFVVSVSADELKNSLKSVQGMSKLPTIETFESYTPETSSILMEGYWKSKTVEVDNLIKLTVGFFTANFAVEKPVYWDAAPIPPPVPVGTPMGIVHSWDPGTGALVIKGYSPTPSMFLVGGVLTQLDPGVVWGLVVSVDQNDSIDFTVGEVVKSTDGFAGTADSRIVNWSSTTKTLTLMPINGSNALENTEITGQNTNAIWLITALDLSDGCVVMDWDPLVTGITPTDTLLLGKVISYMDANQIIHNGTIESFLFNPTGGTTGKGQVIFTTSQLTSPSTTPPWGVLDITIKLDDPDRNVVEISSYERPFSEQTDITVKVE